LLGLRLPRATENKWPYLLSEGYDVKSVATPNYNCIAFAADAGDDVWWWPDVDHDAFWPVRWREESERCFIAAFSVIGYRTCNDPSLERGIEKIAIYLRNGVPTHAAKQLPDGRWKSKLGQLQDIEHNTLKAVEEYKYGKALIFMSRTIMPSLLFICFFRHGGV
jgi:hypothetical protein